MRKFIAVHPDSSIAVVTVLDSKTNQDVINDIPALSDVISNRDIADIDIPSAHIDLRDAWEDSQPGDQIDVSHQKAKDILLEKLRRERTAEFERLRPLQEKAEDTNDTTTLNSILADKQLLRDCTEDLKAVSGTGYNDDTVLADMRSKAVLPTLTN